VAEGKALFERLLSDRKEDPWLHCRYGALLHDLLNVPEEAEAAFRRAIRLKPDFPEAHVNLGLTLGAQGRPREAEAAFRMALKLNPDFPYAHRGMGLALSAQGRHREAEAALRRAIRLKHGYPQAYHNLGEALSSQGWHKEAEEAFRQAIRLKQDNPEALLKLEVALTSLDTHRNASVRQLPASPPPPSPLSRNWPTTSTAGAATTPRAAPPWPPPGRPRTRGCCPTKWPTGCAARPYSGSAPTSPSMRSWRSATTPSRRPS
jgi:tetratricopeptide (TPR) repeat protein